LPLWPLGKGIKIDFYSEVTQEDSDTPNGRVIMRDVVGLTI
jgi:hypothetical protein